MVGKTQAGFSLIEMSIVTIIMGLMIGPMVELYVQYKRAAEIKVTYDQVQTASSLIADFQIITGRYPCPADPRLGPNNANYGREINATCDPALIAISYGTCGMGNGVCYVPGSRDTDYDADTANDAVVIGALPITTIREVLRGVTDDSRMYADIGIDIWGSKLIYAVSRNHVTTSNFRYGNGVIAVQNEFGNPTAGIRAPGDGDYLVLSHGPNRNGAVTKDGSVYSMCGATIGGLDNENCDSDNLFVHAIRNSSVGSGQYDDYIYVSKAVQTALWQNAGSYIYNINPGNVGIATDAPSQKLDINGTLETDSSVQVNLVCSDPSNAATCFDVRSITTNRVRCPAGEVMVRIGNINSFEPTDAAGNCVVPTFNSTLLPNQICPFNRWITGFRSDGGIICSAI